MGSIAPVVLEGVLFGIGVTAGLTVPRFDAGMGFHVTVEGAKIVAGRITYFTS